MKPQNFENHKQHDPAFYGLVILAVIIGFAIWYLAKQVNTVVPLHGLQNIMPFFIPIFLFLLIWKVRAYATKLQDRIIRQEVQLRYFLAAGKQLPSSITLPQMVALRFAGDDEFVSLADQTSHHTERTRNDIKKQIKHWKWDFNRV